MGLKQDLEAIDMTEDEIQDHINRMPDFYNLAVALDKCRHVDCVLKYLLAELETRNRSSYITRIYGRYRKMLPTNDLEILTQWRQLPHESRISNRTTVRKRAR